MNLQDKIEKSIALIQKYEKTAIAMNDEGYFVAFSGGKDSIVIYDLFKRSGCKGQGYFNLTTVDLPEIPIFVRHNYPEVVVLKPKTSMYELISKWQFPTRRRRFCCKELKEYSGVNRLIITGIRGKESNRRSKRKEFEDTCYKNRPPKSFLHPIFDWSSSEVWDYIKSNKLIYPKAYDKGFKRIGCIGCPMSTKNGKQLEFFPKIKQAYINAIQKYYDKNGSNSFSSAHDWYNWWVSGFSIKKYKDLKQQTTLDL